MNLVQSPRNSVWVQNRSQKYPLSLNWRDNTSLKALDTEIVYLIEETIALKEIMQYKLTSETPPPVPQINVLNRVDRSVAFLAGYSSKLSDCPFYFEDAPIKCLVNYCSSSHELPWNCLGLSFFRGVPCEQLWLILVAGKNQDCSTLFDLPGK